jgi:DnaJ homolog subfamily C member 9
MNHIPHSTHEDEARFVVIISGLVQRGELKSLPEWEKSSKDEKARLVRKKQADKEAGEAEALAIELGVWDEFYGSGKTGARNKDKKKGKARAKGKEGEDEDEDGDTAALQALILAKKKKMGGFLDDLAAKYAEPEPKKGRGKGRKGKRAAEDVDEEVDASPKKKQRAAEPDIDDEEFAKLQEKLFGDKAKPTASSDKKSGRSKRGKA